jgi:sugar lactone lactonase YvrE
MAFDPSGNLFAFDPVYAYVRKIGVNGVVSAFATLNGYSYGGILFSAPGIASDSGGSIYVPDRSSAQIHRISFDGTNTIAAGVAYPGNGYSGDGGPALNASLGVPAAVAVDGNGNLYIADGQNGVIRKVTTDGISHTIAGIGASGYSGDGGPATSAQLNGPAAIAVDFSGNVFIADTGNNRIRKISPAGIITTIAGGPTAGFAGDGLPSSNSLLNLPQSLALDSFGNLYVADTLNNRIRKISAGRISSTAAGTGSNVYGDGGPATSAILNHPEAVAVDAAGNVLIADTYDFRIRSVSPAGLITTIAGAAAGSFDNGVAATSAQVGYVENLATDALGNVFYEESNFVRKIAGGVVTTYAGGGHSDSLFLISAMGEPQPAQPYSDREVFGQIPRGIFT